MKLNHNYLYNGLSTLALLVVLIIQLNWLVQTARIKELIFNEKVNMVLFKTVDALSDDTITRRNLTVNLATPDGQKLDSIFRHYMDLYEIDISYHYAVEPVARAEAQPVAPGQQLSLGLPYTSSFEACVPARENQAGLKLSLIFPDKEEFIMAEMGMAFMVSVILIFAVCLMSWRTMFSLMKEKEIANQTTDFLNNMTHELKTPLTNISLAGKLMTKVQNIGSVEKVKHYSSIILNENEKLKNQVDQVLNMNALQRGEILLERSAIDLHQVIAEISASLSVQLENKNGRIKLALKAENARIIGDRIHVCNTLNNLIDNAIKYSSSAPDISVITYNRGQYVAIEIADQGIGIDYKYQHKVFERYYRVPKGNVHDVKGFGMGLAYVKDVISMHSGISELQSSPGEGTTFTILLPYAA